MSRTDQKVIENPKVAALLLDEDERCFLNLFFQTPRTVSDVARELHCERVKVLYHVRKLLKYGLLRVARLEPRAGRAIKHYEASAHRFVVPYVATPSTGAADFIGLLEGTLRDAFYASFLPEADVHLIGVEIGEGDDAAHPSLKLVVYEGGRWQRARDLRHDSVNTLQLVHLRLPDDQARALNRELLEVIERYQARQVQDAPPHLLRLGLVKLKE